MAFNENPTVATKPPKDCRIVAVKDKIKVNENDIVQEDAYLEDLASPGFKFKKYGGGSSKKENRKQEESDDEGFTDVMDKW